MRLAGVISTDDACDLESALARMSLTLKPKAIAVREDDKYEATICKG